MSFESAWRDAQIDGRVQLPRVRALRLYAAARQCLCLEGEFWECGVYRGGSAKLLADVLRDHQLPLVLFDTFCGFAGVTPKDGPRAYDGRMRVADPQTAVTDVLEFVGGAIARVGRIPECFSGLEGSQIAFAHVDVDLHDPTRDALAFILPRMLTGGIVVIDDYSDPDWPGVKVAVDQELVAGNWSAVMEIAGTQAQIHIWH